jgi:hypothetical protein
VTTARAEPKTRPSAPEGNHYPLTIATRRLASVQIVDGKLKPKPNDQLDTTNTDAEGRFSLAREPDPDGKYFDVIVVHPDLYAEVGHQDFEASSTITAKPWGRVEGVIYQGGKPAAGAAIRYSADRIGNFDIPHIYDSGKTRTDDQGRFVLERVLAGDVRVARERRWFSFSSAKLEADGTIRVDDVPPGEYRLSLKYTADPFRGAGLSPDRVAFATKQFTMPEIPGGHSDEPFDLGVLRPRPK